MENKTIILKQIKDLVHQCEPDATIILYGSCARGEEREDSDIDILILVDREQEKMTWTEKMEVAYPINHLELETGIVISPVVYSKKRLGKPQSNTIL